MNNATKTTTRGTGSRGCRDRAEIRRIAVMLDLEWPYPWHHDVYAGIRQYADDCGTWTTIIDEQVPETLRRAGNGDPPYDGIVARATPRLADETRRLGIPLVNVWTDSPVRGVAGVFADFKAIGRLAAEHLIDRGLDEFACLAVRRHRATGLASRGFHDAIARAGGRCRCCEVRQHSRTPAAWRDTVRTIDRWIDDWPAPVGVFIGLADATARQVASRCLERGLRIPEDVALVMGLDDEARNAEPAPSLTGINLPFAEVGRRAACLLDELLASREQGHPTILVAPGGVVSRDSTARHEDENVGRALSFMAAEAHRDLDVSDIAAAAGTPRRTLERRFRKSLGHSVSDALRAIRIERAQRMLANSSRPIKEISLKCGFGRSVRMGEVFRREVGCSPTAYRLQARAARDAAGGGSSSVSGRRAGSDTAAASSPRLSETPRESTSRPRTRRPGR